MFVSNSLKFIKFRLFIKDYLKYCEFRQIKHIQTENSTKAVLNDKDTLLEPSKDIAEKKLNTNIPSEYTEFLDETSLSKTDKQSLDLAQHISEPNYLGTFNLAAYLNKSETLQQLHKLGVDFSKIEKRKGIGQFVLQLDFEKDIKSHLTFLNDVGVPANSFGEFLTKNPLIFKESLDDLQTRINYLEVKKFKTSQIQRICTLNPYWLMFSTKRIDKRLGYFQQNFKLTGHDVRHLATKLPRLITYKMDHIRENTFSIKEEMGFEGEEVKCLLLSKPKLWMMNREEIVERFDYAHNNMKLSHELILLYPHILTSRLFRIKERHKFLKYLGKAQYDMNEGQFISPKQLVEGTDEYFVKNICNSSMEEYENFLRTL
ncbi:transcription termination factor 3, mitochondrial [Condylostylus longicornis]|uniref:transcription termination factor 3, mitochondrial n=1 Tax=Condylostylus longicornis TaxID=2530218 RepID=UPI00244E10E2|nr:transcription termination factor 3, mitochondrial [Condylostylus longicornis]